MSDETALQVKSNVEEYFKNLDNELDIQVLKSLMMAALHVEGVMKQTIAETFSGGKGQLARNPKAVLLGTKGEISSSAVFLDLVYAWIQDQGGVIRPRSVNNLAIPLTDKARTPGKWPRTWERGIGRGKLQFYKSRAGNKLLAEMVPVGKGKNRRVKITNHYVLKPQVTIRGKGYIERARKASEAGVAEIMGDMGAVVVERTDRRTGAPR